MENMETIELDKLTQFKANFPEIKAPRWSDDTFIIQANVAKHNKLHCVYIRPDGTRMFPEPLYISGTTARKYRVFEMPTMSGYRMKMRAVPIKEFKRLKLSARSMYV